MSANRRLEEVAKDSGGEKMLENCRKPAQTTCRTKIAPTAKDSKNRVYWPARVRKSRKRTPIAPILDKLPFLMPKPPQRTQDANEQLIMQRLAGYHIPDMSTAQLTLPKFDPAIMGQFAAHERTTISVTPVTGVVSNNDLVQHSSSTTIPSSQVPCFRGSSQSSKRGLPMPDQQSIELPLQHRATENTFQPQRHAGGYAQAQEMRASWHYNFADGLEYDERHLLPEPDMGLQYQRTTRGRRLMRQRRQSSSD